MTATAPLTLDGPLLAAATRLRDIAAAKADLEAEEKQLKEQLRAAVEPGTTCVDPAGTPLLTVRPGAARFSATRAAEVLPADLLASISVTAPDGKRAKDLLAPALYAGCCIQSQAAVVPL